MISSEENKPVFPGHRPGGQPVPNEFFDVVLPRENINTSRLCLLVLRYTIGIGQHEWWLTTPREIMRVAGIKSRAGLTTALLDAREKGYIIQRLLDDGEHTIALRPRFQGDAPDIPLARHGFVGDLSGYVYLIRRPVDGYYKIGYSKQPEVRAIDLTSAIGQRVEVIHLIECDDMPGAEKDLHREFDQYRVAGEWFALPAEAVAAITRLMSYTAGHWLEAPS